MNKYYKEAIEMLGFKTLTDSDVIVLRSPEGDEANWRFNNYNELGEWLVQMLLLNIDNR